MKVKQNVSIPLIMQNKNELLKRISQNYIY